MKRKSILYKDLEVSRAKEIYDESCKNILANKNHTGLDNEKLHERI